MPSLNELDSHFQPALARTIASSKWRKPHKTCFCDLVLHHIQEMMTPFDMTTACPEDMHHLIQGLKRVFNKNVVKDLAEEINAPINKGGCTLVGVEARIASETWEGQLRPWVARVLCIGLVDEAYEEAEKQPVAEIERKEKAKRRGKGDDERLAQSSKVQKGIKAQMCRVAQSRFVDRCRRPMLGFVKDGFSQIGDALADVV